MFHGSNYLGSMEALPEVPISLFAAFIELRDRAETLGGAPPSPPPAQVHHEPPPRAPPDTALALPARAAAVSAGTGPVSPKHLPARGAPPHRPASLHAPPPEYPSAILMRVPTTARPHQHPRESPFTPPGYGRPRTPRRHPTGPVEPAAATQTPAGARRAIPKPQRRDPARHPSPAPHHMPRATPTDQPPLPARRSCPPP